MYELKQSEIKELRDKLSEQQDNKCLICGDELDEGCSLDHQHKKRLGGSGKIRGVLCRGCNIYLGKIENNCKRFGVPLESLPSRLRDISVYLELPHLDYLHPSERQKKPILSKRCFNRLSKVYSLDKPNNKPLEYPKNKHLTKKLEVLFQKYCILIEFNR